MPVNSSHPDYLEMLPVWESIDVALKGRRAVLAGGDAYLPKLALQTPEGYKAYQGRAVWFGATAKTAAGWVGIVTRKPPSITAPDSLQSFLNDCDRRGTAFSSYVQTVARDLVEKSRCGTLIDWTPEAVPYVTHYKAEQIINWDMISVKGERMLSFLMLHETSTKYEPATGGPAPDRYEKPAYDQWREFRLEGAEDGKPVVTMTIWRVKATKATSVTTTAKKAAQEALKEDAFVEISSVVLTRRGGNLPAIPFVLHTSANIPPECVAKPMLEDIADLNFNHWRASADIWNGRHMAGMPTPWAAGFTDDKTTHLTLGTAQVWVTDEPEAKCGMLEMTGKALESIKEGMAELERNMAALGAQAIEPQKKEAEAVGTVELRNRAESASLVTLTEQSSKTLSLVLQWAFWAFNADPRPQAQAKTVYVILPQAVTSGRMKPEEVTALVNAYNLGSVSFETMYHNFRAGELYADDRTEEEERTAIEEGGPKPPMPEPEPGTTPPPSV